MATRTIATTKRTTTVAAFAMVIRGGKAKL